jgi:hypothetical protein
MFRRCLLASVTGRTCALLLVGWWFVPVLAQTPAGSLELYAVNIVKTVPFRKKVTGYGVYLGQGTVLTAAHVVGRWPFITRLHVLMAGQYFPAEVVKEGSFEKIDLALLSFDQNQLPVSLRLRRNPLCRAPPRIGMAVVDVIPQSTIPSQVISPLQVPQPLQQKFDTLVDTPKVSGSGIFDPEQQCLLGIVSAKIEKYAYQRVKGRIIWAPNGFAGYFVSAARIAEFLPADFRY